MRSGLDITGQHRWHCYGERGVMNTNGKWQNRIVRTAMVDPEQLLAHPLNYRIHPKHQQDALQGSLDELGWYKRIVCQDQTDVVIDGHARVTLALRNNEPLVPVDYVDFSDEETNLALATGDPISALAQFDRAKFAELLEDTGTGEPALQELLARMATEQGIVPPDEFDPNAEWQGMPEFQQEDQTAAFKAIVNFAREEDVAEFERLVGQHIPRNTKSIWFPKVEHQDFESMRYVTDES